MELDNRSSRNQEEEASYHGLRGVIRYGFYTISQNNYWQKEAQMHWASPSTKATSRAVYSRCVNSFLATKTYCWDTEIKKCPPKTGSINKPSKSTSLKTNPKNNKVAVNFRLLFAPIWITSSKNAIFLHGNKCNLPKPQSKRNKFSITRKEERKMYECINQIWKINVETQDKYLKSKL